MWVRFPPVAFSPGFIPGDFLSQSRRLPLLQVVSKNKSFSVGVQSPTEINAPRGCAVILKRICQLSLTRITHQVSRAFDLNYHKKICNTVFIILLWLNGMFTKREHNQYNVSCWISTSFPLSDGFRIHVIVDQQCSHPDSPFFFC